MRKIIAYLIALFGINTVDRAVKGLSKAMTNLHKVVDRQQAKAIALEQAAIDATKASIQASEEVEKAKKVLKNLGKLFD